MVYLGPLIRDRGIEYIKLDEVMKHCWYCGGMNLAQARKCEHCGGGVFEEKSIKGILTLPHTFFDLVTEGGEYLPPRPRKHVDYSAYERE